MTASRVTRPPKECPTRWTGLAVADRRAPARRCRCRARRRCRPEGRRGRGVSNCPRMSTATTRRPGLGERLQDRDEVFLAAGETGNQQGGPALGDAADGQGLKRGERAHRRVEISGSGRQAAGSENAAYSRGPTIPLLVTCLCASLQDAKGAPPVRSRPFFMLVLLARSTRTPLLAWPLTGGRRRLCTRSEAADGAISSSSAARSGDWKITENGLAGMIFSGCGRGAGASTTASFSQRSLTGSSSHRSVTGSSSHRGVSATGLRLRVFSTTGSVRA